MQTKNYAGSPLASDVTDPDEIPELTDEFFADAEVFHGDTFVRRGRGRPKTGNAKELISIRLEPAVLEKLREAGPGWQSQVNTLLRADLIIPEELIDRDIATATALRDRWMRHLASCKQTGAGRLRIGERWETAEEAVTRLQGIVDHHARTIELMEGMRAVFPNAD